MSIPLDYMFDDDDNQDLTPGPDDDMIIIRYFSTESEAQIASAVLSKESIPNFLSNMFMNQLLPTANDSIAMHIRKTDQKRAQKILLEFEDNSHIDPDNLDIDLDQGLVKLNEKHYNLRTPKIWYIILIIFIIIVLIVHAFNQPQDFKFW